MFPDFKFTVKYYIPTHQYTFISFLWISFLCFSFLSFYTSVYTKFILVLSLKIFPYTYPFLLFEFVFTEQTDKYTKFPKIPHNVGKTFVNSLIKIIFKMFNLGLEKAYIFF